MLDGTARPLIDPALQWTGRRLAALGISANQVTVTAWLTGLAGAGAIAGGYFGTALVLMAISRIGDGLDGAVAKTSGASDYGGYLDIVLDYVFYGAVPLGFIVLDPVANGLAGAVLLFSFYVNGASFLAYSIMAEKRAMVSEARGTKSLYFTTGLAEASETFITFAAFCIFPGHFSLIAWVFTGLCLITAGSRILLAGRVFT